MKKLSEEKIDHFSFFEELKNLSKNAEMTFFPSLSRIN